MPNDTVPISPEGLAWWLRIAPTLDWTEARTYAKSATHAYVVLGRTPGPSRTDFIRAAHVIHTFGEPGRFWSSTNVYLAEGRFRWWTMDPDLRDTDLINRAVNDRVYGVQDAPRTHYAGFTAADAVGASWDREHQPNEAWGEAARQRAAEHFGAEHRPTVLDIECGTGTALDLGLTTPDRYTGVDPSQAMLNRLVMKHPGVHRLLAAQIEEVPGGLLSPRYDVVVVRNENDQVLERFRGLAELLLINGD